MKLLVILFLLFSVSFGQKPGDTVFAGAQVHTFVFHFDYPSYLDSLYKSNADGDYILGSVSINGADFDSVGVRFKGTSSFDNYPSHKKSFRIKLNKYKVQEFNGLKRINLNNGWSDPSMLREKLYLDFLYQQNITAPRANFAKVYIDSLYWGLYTMVEQVDKTFLEHRFNNNNGNLYKAEGQSYLDWRGANQENYYSYYDLKTNEKENDRGDLVRLLDVINNSSNDNFAKALDSIFEIDSFVRAWAANNFIINRDSYFGSANNFYLYMNKNTDKFSWIIWDTNLTFGGRGNSDSLDIFWYGSPRPLIERLLSFPQYREIYIQSMNEIEKAFDESFFFSKIDTLFSLIKPYYFSDSLKMYSNEQAQENLNITIDRNPGLKSFIVNRKYNVKKQLVPLISSIHFSGPVPASITLSQNYPNPFNSKTTISYSVGENNDSNEQGGSIGTKRAVSLNVNLSIFNLLGQKIAVLVNKKQTTGRYAISFEAGQMTSGIYLYILKTSSGFVACRKMILLK